MKLAEHLGQASYCAKKETEARDLPRPAMGGGRPMGLGSLPPWAGPFSVCCVSCCSVVRFKNGQGSNLDGGNYHVYENGSLEIKMIRKEDQGIYTCVATNILGKAENQVRLEVKGKRRGSLGRGHNGWVGGTFNFEDAISSKLPVCVPLKTHHP